jgi:membrane-associated protease RseP (regulator of RpoE activity)
MDATLLFLALFLAAAVMLVFSKVERYVGVLFIIRSSFGIRLIDSLARFKPRLWEFLADFSVLLSFGGLGAYYLSVNEETRHNLYRSMVIIGAICSLVALLLGKVAVAFGFLALGVLFSYLMRRIGSPLVDSLFAAMLFLLSCGMVLDASASFLFGVFGLPALMVYVLFTHGVNILEAKTTLPGVSPMLPSSKDGNLGVGFPGYDLFVPWWHALIALFITLVAHEGAHGILVRTANVRLKSTGVLSLLSLPIGAFVEPDEEELNRKTSVDRMRVFTMGSFANLVVGVLAVLAIAAMLNVFAAVVSSDGMRVVGFIDGYPAKGVIPADTVIRSLNGKPTTDFAMFRNATSGLAPGDMVELSTTSGAFKLKLAADPSDAKKAMIGVYLLENLRVDGPAGALISVKMMSFLIDLFGWVAFFNINIALVNLLPVVPFDGGRMFKEVVSAMRISDLNVKRINRLTIALMAALFIMNLLPLITISLDYLGAGDILNFFGSFNKLRLYIP